MGSASKDNHRMNEDAMKRLTRMRPWVTPISIGAFISAAVTGIMLFFRLDLGMVKIVHEWLSWSLVAGTIFHVISNWKFMTGSLGSHLGRGIIAVFIITCTCLVPAGVSHGENPHKTSEILLHSSLSSVAMTAGHKPEETLSMLRAKGMRIEATNQNIAEIARNKGRSPVNVLDIIFKTDQENHAVTTGSSCASRAKAEALPVSFQERTLIQINRQKGTWRTFGFASATQNHNPIGHCQGHPQIFILKRTPVSTTRPYTILI